MRLTDEEISVIAHEAFMVGRVYNAGGEKEPPDEIHVKLMMSVGRALVMHRAEKRKRHRAKLRSAPPRVAEGER